MLTHYFKQIIHTFIAKADIDIDTHQDVCFAMIIHKRLETEFLVLNKFTELFLTV